MSLRTLTRSASLLAVLAVCSLSGCSDEKRMQLPEASLKGTISYKGKPVPYALVIVQNGQASATGNADENGNYSVANVAPGQLDIGVNTEAGRGQMMGATMAAAQSGNKAAKPTFVDLPKKFHDPKTSGLKASISDPKGVTTHNIEIQ